MSVCVSKRLLHCLKQTESKYGEALSHCDGLGKYNTYCDILKHREINGKDDVELLTERKKMTDFLHF